MVFRQTRRFLREQRHLRVMQDRLRISFFSRYFVVLDYLKALDTFDRWKE